MSGMCYDILFCDNYLSQNKGALY